MSGLPSTSPLHALRPGRHGTRLPDSPTPPAPVFPCPSQKPALLLPHQRDQQGNLSRVQRFAAPWMPTEPCAHVSFPSGLLLSSLPTLAWRIWGVLQFFCRKLFSSTLPVLSSLSNGRAFCFIPNPSGVKRQRRMLRTSEGDFGGSLGRASLPTGSSACRELGEVKHRHDSNGEPGRMPLGLHLCSHPSSARPLCALHVSGNPLTSVVFGCTLEPLAWGCKAFATGVGASRGATVGQRAAF